MELRFLGHACFELSDGVHRVLTDPYLTGNPLAAAGPEEVEPDFIFVTHGHHDHVGDTAAIARRTGAAICCTADLADAVFQPAGVPVLAGNLGGTMRLPFGSAKIFQALHGSGAAGCLSCGFIFEMGGKKVYHAGDTALMMDMLLLKDGQPLFGTSFASAETVEHALEEVSKYCYLRTGDLVCVELRSREPLCTREDGSCSIEGSCCGNYLLDFRIIF